MKKFLFTLLACLALSNLSKAQVATTTIERETRGSSGSVVVHPVPGSLISHPASLNNGGDVGFWAWGVSNSSIITFAYSYLFYPGTEYFTVTVGELTALAGGYKMYEDPTHSARLYIRRVMDAYGWYFTFYVVKIGGL